MILIAGGTGQLGTRVVELLTTRGLEVRVLTREPARAQHLKSDLTEVVPGDVENRADVVRAARGAGTIISAIHGFTGNKDHGPRAVDWKGNGNLIKAAKAGGAEHFILDSVQQAAPDHPGELYRMKYMAEQELRASGLAWTIIRPTAYMETWGKLVGEPLVKTGKTMVFGRGNNPINFVSAYDVARFVELAVVDPALRNAVIEVSGPENLTMRQVVSTFERETGKKGKVSSVPLPAMRVMSVLMRPVNAVMTRQIETGVMMDTRDMCADPSERCRRYPSIALTSLAEVVRRDYL